MLRSLSISAANRFRHIGMKEIIIAAVAVLMIALLISIPGIVKFLGIKREAPPEVPREGLPAALSVIEQRSGELKVAESEGKELYIDTATLNLRVVDTASRTVWNSTHQEGGYLEKSPLIIRYLGRDSSMYEWDAFTYSIQNGRYELYQIENGVRIVYDFFETESYRLNEYMPQRISAESYQRNFLDKLEEKTASGEISEAQAARYKENLSIAYQYDADGDLYFFKFAGLPPLSLVRDLINFSKAVEYTTEMLIEDSQQFGINITILEPARFGVTMEATLDRGDLLIRVPTYEVTSGNDFYMLQNITVLPSFGLASAEQVADGYIFVPDGAGALFKLNTFNGRYPEYDRPIYNNRYYDELYEMPEFPENLMMPVFGMYYTDQSGRSRGFLGIVEQGEELGSIKVQLGAEDTSAGGTPYNKVFSTFDATQFSRVKVFGPHSDNDARFLATTELIPVDYKVRYKLFGQQVDYYDLAKTYKDYLVDRYDLTLSYAEPKAKLFFDVIGTLTIKKHVLGIPFKELFSMTTYEELLAIMEDLQGIGAIVNYKGVFNNGLHNKIMNKAELVKANGSKEAFKRLMDAFDGENRVLFLNADLMRVWERDDGFRPRSHALHGFNSKPVEFLPYNYHTGKFDLTKTKSYLLHPLYLSDTVDRFIADSEAYPNIFLNEMGSTYYANYNRREIIDPITAGLILEDNLRKLSEHKKLALDNPNMNRIPYAEYATNISRESSNYGSMYSSIPFRQLVLNGLTAYTTLNVNMSAERSSYYVLQALELGSIPKFTISAKSSDLLKNTEFSDYFSIQYAGLKDKIKAIYDEYSAGLEKIGSTEITDHRMLDHNVFQTTYASGVKVIVNYNKFPVTAAGYQLDALGYVIDSSQ